MALNSIKVTPKHKFAETDFNYEPMNAFRIII